MNETAPDVNNTPGPVNNEPFDLVKLEPGNAVKAPATIQINVLCEAIEPGHPAHHPEPGGTITQTFLFRFVLDLTGEQFPEMFLPQGKDDEPIRTNEMGEIPPGQLAITTFAVPKDLLAKDPAASSALVANAVDMAKKDLFDLVHLGLREWARENQAKAAADAKPKA